MAVTLKLSLQEQVIPGDSLTDKFNTAKAWGYDALELRGKGDFAFEKRLDEIVAAREAGADMPTECVEMDHFFGDFDAERRRDAIDNLKTQLTTMAKAGGHAVLTPASWGMFSLRLPPFTPPRTPEDDEKVLIEGLTELGLYAQKEGVMLLLEPLNRYEDHMVNTIGRAVELCQKVNLSSIGIVADIYHMNIEEDDIYASLLAGKDYIKHIQINDTNRLQPGMGHFDFVKIFQTLIEMEYDGYLALECRLRGEPEAALAEAAQMLRAKWTEAQS